MSRSTRGKRYSTIPNYYPFYKEMTSLAVGAKSKPPHTTPPWIIIGSIVIMSLAIVLIVVFVTLHFLTTSSSTKIKRDLPIGMLYHLPLTGSYNDTAGNSIPQLTLPNIACLPSFVSMVLPDGNTGLAWNNQCPDMGQAIFLQSNTTIGNSYSMCGWFNFMQFPTYTSQTILFGSLNYNGFGGNYYTVLRPMTTSDDTLRMRNVHTGGFVLPTISFSPALSVNQWIHFCLTYDDTAMIASMYINGQLTITNTVPVETPLWNSIPHDQTLIGGSIQNYMNSKVYGSIYEIQIYNISLTHENVTTVYDHQSGDIVRPIYTATIVVGDTLFTNSSSSSSSSAGGVGVSSSSSY